VTALIGGLFHQGTDTIELTKSNDDTRIDLTKINSDTRVDLTKINSDMRAELTKSISDMRESIADLKAMQKAILWVLGLGVLAAIGKTFHWI